MRAPKPFHSLLVACSMLLPGGLALAQQNGADRRCRVARHDAQREILALCDDMLVLELGRTTHHGPPAQLFQAIPFGL